jgi:hypothetical protein
MLYLITFNSRIPKLCFKYASTKLTSFHLPSVSVSTIPKRVAQPAERLPLPHAIQLNERTHQHRLHPTHALVRLPPGPMKSGEVSLAAEIYAAGSFPFKSCDDRSWVSYLFYVSLFFSFLRVKGGGGGGGGAGGGEGYSISLRYNPN